MKIATIEEIGATRWDDYVDSHKQAGIYHLSTWNKMLSAVFNSNCHYLAAVDDSEDVCGVLPLVHFDSRFFGNFLVSMPYFNHGGVLTSNPEAESALIEKAIDLADKFDVSHVELREFSPRSGIWKYKNEKVLMHLNLPADPDVLWKAIGAKRRSQIKRPEREGVSVKTGGVEMLHDFYAVFSRNMRDLGTPVYTKELFRTILEKYPDHAYIVVVYLGERPVAVAFLLGFRQVIEIPWASSIREFNRLGVNMKLYWEVLKLSIARGYQVFDFGRSTIDGPTYKFKKQWGAEPKQCYWNYWLAEGNDLPQLNPQNPKYKIAIEMWKKLPLPVANYFGPHIVKHFP